MQRSEAIQCCPARAEAHQCACIVMEADLHKCMLGKTVHRQHGMLPTRFWPVCCEFSVRTALLIAESTAEGPEPLFVNPKLPTRSARHTAGGAVSKLRNDIVLLLQTSSALDNLITLHVCQTLSNVRATALAVRDAAPNYVTEIAVCRGS